MRWHCLQHVSFEGPAYLAEWASSRGHVFAQTRLWEGESFPSMSGFDGLFILGGPMNVYEEDRYPWLAGEKEFIGSAVKAGKPVLGICLGAQLLSVVLGGSVSANTHKEIGWFPVERTPAGRTSKLFRDFPDLFPAFHWHGDRFTIPPGATHVARSRACETQAFVHGDRVVGLQFHLESTRESIAAIIEHSGGELIPGAFIQDITAMQKGMVGLAAGHLLIDTLLDTLGRVTE